jgi:hypothetical protein
MARMSEAMTANNSQRGDAFDEAEAVVDEALKGVWAETGGNDESGGRLFTQRVASSDTLRTALALVHARRYATALDIVRGDEPVPGAPGEVRLRDGGPPPREDQERLALEGGIPSSACDDVTRALEAEDPDEDD